MVTVTVTVMVMVMVMGVLKWTPGMTEPELNVGETGRFRH
jgi:hypothetical protein